MRRRSRKRLTTNVLAVVAVIAAFLAPSVGAQGGTPLIINSTGSAPDVAPGDGVCDTGLLNTEGDPECTLIAAIVETNSGPLNEITFDIPVSDPRHTAGVWTIQTPTAYPQVIAPVVIDGRTQPGWTEAPVVEVDGSLSPVANGLIFPAPAAGSSILGLGWVNFPESPLIVGADNSEIAYNYIGVHYDGVSPGPSLNGLVLSNAQGVTVHDNVISGNTQSGMVLVGAGATMNSIDGNLIGTTADGTAALGNGPAGISMIDASNNIFGRNDANVIASNGGDGIVLRNSDSNIFENNLIGLSVNGTALPNGWSGMMFLNDSANNMIGAVGSPNTIVASGRDGISFEGSSRNVVEGNFIGTDSAGNPGLGNTRDGILTAQNGAIQVLSNVISYNGQNGIAVGADSTGPMTILNNTFVGNNRLAIDLKDDGLTPNDPGDGDGGANGLLNYPEIVRTSENAAGAQVYFEEPRPQSPRISLGRSTTSTSLQQSRHRHWSRKSKVRR